MEIASHALSPDPEDREVHLKTNALGVALTTVFIVDDHELVAATLKEILDREGDFLVVGIAADGTSAIEKLLKTAADIVLLDLVLPGEHGLGVAREILARFPGTKIAVCSGVESDEAIELAFATGVHCYVEKRMAVGEMLASLRMLRNGHSHLTVRQACVLKNLVQRRAVRKPLGMHDTGILRRLALNQSAKRIAEEEGVSQSCVYKARKRIAERAGFCGAGDLRAAAARMGLVPPDLLYVQSE